MRISDWSSDVCSSDLMDAISIVNDYGKDWNNVKVVTQEFKLSSAPSKNSLLNWTAGTFLFHQNAPTKQGTHFGADAGMMGPGTPTNATSILANSAVNQGVAVFGQLGFQFGNGLELQAGLRYDYEHATRSEERRVGKEGVSTCRYWWSP